MKITYSRAAVKVINSMDSATKQRMYRLGVYPYRPTPSKLHRRGSAGIEHRPPQEVNICQYQKHSKNW